MFKSKPVGLLVKEAGLGLVDSLLSILHRCYPTHAFGHPIRHPIGDGILTDGFEQVKIPTRCRKWATRRLTIITSVIQSPCGRMLEELPEGYSYIDDYTWTISFENLGDNNELASKVFRF
jgi:hypothetical protein